MVTMPRDVQPEASRWLADHVYAPPNALRSGAGRGERTRGPARTAAGPTTAPVSPYDRRRPAASVPVAALMKPAAPPRHRWASAQGDQHVLGPAGHPLDQDDGGVI